MSNVIEVLQERGFIDALTTEEMEEIASKPTKVYCGFDPTSDSLHLGNLVAIMGLAWFQKFGHTPYAIVGGATGLIGDPSGKSDERQLLDEAQIEVNLAGIRKNLEAVLDFKHPSCPPVLLNIYDWMKNYTFITFLRDVGKYFRVGPMLAKDSVKSRLDSEEGLSFTEFSYQLIQGYDFLYLYDNFGVTVQVGGSDQWGNITAGKDLVRKIRGKSVHGVTFPLLTTSDGKKFGKTEKGAIWLSPDKLSPYEFYQSLYRVEDADVIKLLKMLTFLEMDEICAIELEMKSDRYVPNAAQRRLAEEVTRLVHGEDSLKKALRATEAVRPGATTKLDASTLESVAADMPCHSLNRIELVDQKLIDIITLVGMSGSKGEARRLIRNGGVYLNNHKVDDENYVVEGSNIIEDRLLLIAIGKKNKMLIRVSS